MSYKCCFLDVAYVRFNYNLFSNILLSFFFYIFVVHDSCLLQYHAVSTGKHVETFHYQLMHIMLKNTELLKHSKITLQHVSVYAETIFRELQSVLG